MEIEFGKDDKVIINVPYNMIPYKETGKVTMFIKSKDFVSSSRGSISALSADIVPKWNHIISIKSADITTLGDISRSHLKEV